MLRTTDSQATRSLSLALPPWEFLPNAACAPTPPGIPSKTGLEPKWLRTVSIVIYTLCLNAVLSEALYNASGTTQQAILFAVFIFLCAHS